MRRLQEEEDRQQAEKQHRHQEELRKMQDQAMKEEKKRKFEQLLTGSGNKFMKPPGPSPLPAGLKYQQVYSGTENCLNSYIC